MWVVVVDVEHEESYWYPDDGGEVWVAGYYPVDASGRFLSRAELEALGLIATHVAQRRAGRCGGAPSPTTRTTRRRSRF